MDGSRDHPSKSWLQKNFPRGSKHSIEQVASTVHRVQKIQREDQRAEFRSAVSFSSVTIVNLASSFPGILLPCFFFLSRAARVVGIFPWSPVSWQGRSTPVSDGSNGRCGRQRAQQGATPFSTARTTPRLRVAVLSAGVHRKTVAVAWIL